MSARLTKVRRRRTSHAHTRTCLRVLLVLLASSALGACFEVAVASVPRTDHIDITATRSTLIVGDTVRVAAIPRRSNGTPPTRPVGYSSSDARRATVAGKGLVTAIAPGTVQIIAKSDGKSARVQLVVRSVPPASP